MITLSKAVFRFKNVHKNTPIYLSLHNKNSLEIGDKVDLNHVEGNIELFKGEKGSNIGHNIPELAVRIQKSEHFKDICLREQTEYDIIIAIPLEKNQIKKIQKESDNPLYPLGNLKLKNHLSFNNFATWYENEGYTYISGRLNYKNFVGLSKFYFDKTISGDVFEVEVLSSKISYEDDFKSLIVELADIQTELVLSLDEPTEVSLDSQELIDKTSFQAILLQLRRLMSEDNLPLAVQTILSNPHSTLSYDTEIEKVGFPGTFDLSRMSANPLELNWIKSNKSSRPFKGFTPTEYHKERIDRSFNTRENQYIKFCLEELEGLINNLLVSLPLKYQNSKSFLKDALKEIEEYLYNPLFKQVGSLSFLNNSMVLQRKSGYKEFTQLIHSFEYGIRLSSEVNEFDSLNGDLRPISELYEYWCFFQIYYSLKEICGGQDLDLSSLLLRTDKGYKLNLNKKSQTSIHFLYHDMDISLYYNRNFIQNNSETWEGTYDKGLFHPDISLSIKNKIQTHWIHFDSKYKLDKAKLDRMINGEMISDGSYLRNDIHTAHAYRDAILGSRGVFIIYPDLFLNESIFKRYPDANQKHLYPIPSVGAFPLKPGLTYKGQLSNIESFLKKTFDFISLNILYQEETGFWNISES